MLRGLLKLILVVVVLVGIAAFFVGYRWAMPEADDRPAAGAGTTAPVGTSGTLADERDRAREVGAEIGETVAAGAGAAQRALANGQLTAKIKSKMALDDTVRASAIDVDSREGVVTLSGAVGSAAQRDRALQLARETDGVSSVVDRLQVR